MISRRLPSLGLAGVLVLSIGARVSFAQSGAEELSRRLSQQTGPTFLFLSKSTANRDEKLKSDMAKLMSDARAGKLKAPVQLQLPAGKSNNLSKTAKIAIIAGVAVVVVGLVGWYAFTHGGSCKSRCVL